MAEWLTYAWVPFVTALIGWLTNWVAIQMLFRPRREQRFLGLRFQGLIPRRQGDLAEKSAEVIERELLNQHRIREELNHIDVETYMTQFLHRFVRHRLGERLRKLPLIGGFVNDSTLGQLEAVALDALKEEVEPLKHRLAEDLEKKLHIRELVETRIREFDLDKLEEVVLLVARQEFRAIEILGGILGFIIGLAQLGILAAMGSL